MLNIKTIVFALAITIILAAGCTQTRNNTESFKMGFPIYVGEGPYYVAQEKGFFAEEGLNVEFIAFSDPAVIKSAFLGNQIQVYAFTVDSFAFDAGNGLPGKIFWLPSASNGADGIITRSDIQTIQDLRNKKIAFFEGSPSHFLLGHLLLENNLTFSDIQGVNLEPDKAAEAFFTGEVDAAVTWEPWLSKTQTLSNGHVLVSSAEIPERVVDAFIARDDFLQQHPDTLQKFVRALLRGIQYSKDYPEEAAAIAAPYFNMTPAEYLESIQTIQFLSREDNQRMLADNGPAIQILTEANQIWRTAGLIQNPQTPSNLVDNRIANQAS